jgi:tRNA threonylcarbamoyladenosine biosynthesis protein TsaE
MVHEILSSEEMFDLARGMAEQWNGYGMVALIGPMGAGKTHFSKGFAAGMGFTNEVTSPTFALLQEYRGGKLPIFHFDWYRVELSDEILEIGWDEYESQGVLLVEWADLFPSLWPEKVTVVRIEITDKGRLVTVE